MNKSRLLGALSACFLAIYSACSFANDLGCPDPSGFPTSSGCSLPGTGIRPSGFPYFDQAVKVKYKGKKDRDFSDFNVNASFNKNSGRSLLVFDSGNPLFIGKTKFKFKAKVRDGVASGSVTINGIIEGLGITKKEELFTANLEGPWALSGDQQLLGFNTGDIVCNEAFASYCTESESIYLALVDAINAGDKNIKTTGVAVTTVPLPAAAWLFGSGLLGLAGMSRRKKAS
jgi:hypothetical protein